jgi:hypothetical protein
MHWRRAEVGEYRIGPEDMPTFSVEQQRDQPDCSRQARREKLLPLVNDVQAAGLTQQRAACC